MQYGVSGWFLFWETNCKDIIICINDDDTTWSGLCIYYEPVQLLQLLLLQKALFDTNIHEHNNNIHVIMLCLETLIKVYTYRLHKSHQGRSDGIRVILSTIACDQRNKTTFFMKWTHSFAQWAAVYKWTYKIYFFNMMALVTAIGARYKPVIDQVVDCTI